MLSSSTVNCAFSVESAIAVVADWPSLTATGRQNLPSRFGCEIHHAGDLAYADEFEASWRRTLEPIGIGCAVWERMDCAQRAHPPVGHKVKFVGYSRRIRLYDLES